MPILNYILELMKLWKIFPSPIMVDNSCHVVTMVHSRGAGRAQHKQNHGARKCVRRRVAAVGF